MIVMSRRGGGGVERAGGSMVSNDNVTTALSDVASSSTAASAAVCLTPSAAMWLSGRARRSSSDDDDETDADNLVLDPSQVAFGGVMSSNSSSAGAPAVMGHDLDLQSARSAAAAPPPPPTPASTPKWRSKTATAKTSIPMKNEESREELESLTSFSALLLPEQRRHPLLDPRFETGTKKPKCSGPCRSLKHANDSLYDGKRKREKDSTTTGISTVGSEGGYCGGVDGLEKGLKRVCLKAKFHRRTRRHVSLDDLTRIGDVHFMEQTTDKSTSPVYITPEKKENQRVTAMEPTCCDKTSVRSSGTDISTTLEDLQELEQVPFNSQIKPLSNETNLSLVTDIAGNFRNEMFNQIVNENMTERTSQAPESKRSDALSRDSLFKQDKCNNQRVVSTQSSTAEDS